MKELTFMEKLLKNSFFYFPSLLILVKDFISLNKDEVVDLLVMIKGSFVFDEGT